jgi:competence protein ComEA
MPAVAQTTQTAPPKSTGMSAPATPPVGKADATAPATTATAPAGLLDINSATEADLDALPGVGKTRAAAIIKHRPYKGKDDLVKKKVLPSNVYNGIKDKIIAKQG